jgi:pilus assembly protein CpaE
VLQIFGKSIRKAKRILRIGFVTADPHSAGPLKKSVSDSEGVDLAVIASSAIQPGVQPPSVGVFLYDLDITSEAAMAEFDRFMHARPAEVPVIVLSPAVDEELVRWFLRLRVADWLKVPLGPGELIAACGRAVSQLATGKTEVQCTTFMNARGGAGSTTLAIHAALLSAQKTLTPSSTILVDLNLTAGCCAEYLDLQPGWQIDELVGDPSRLDRRMFDLMTVKHASGINVLAAQRNFFAPPIPAEEAITGVLDIATQTHQNMVIDMPRQAEKWSDAVLLGSSNIFIVTDFSIPGLRTGRRLAEDMTAFYGGELKPKIIVNKYARSFFGSALSSHEVSKVLGDLLAGYVPAEDSLLREASDRGIPSTEIKSKNAIITAMTKIMEGK